MSSGSTSHARQDAAPVGPGTTQRRSFVRTSVVLAPAMAVATLLQYVVQVVAARTLPEGDFGGFGALLACTVVGSVSLLAVQAVVARRMSWAIDADGLRRDVRELVPPAWWCGAAIAGATALAAPGISAFLHVPLVAALLLAVGLAPLPMVGVGLGAVQGQRRTLTFAAIYFAYAALRLIFVTAGLLVHPTTTVAMAGVAVGSFVTALLAWWVVRRPDTRRGRPDVLPRRRLWPEVGRTALALLAVLALANVDLLMARHRLPALSSDQYALGSLAARAVFWLLQFAAVAAYADLSSRRSWQHRRATLLTGLGVVVGLGLLGTAVAAAIPPTVVADSVGARYASVTALLPLFAALGTALAATQYLLMAGVARGRSAAGGFIAAAAVLEAAALSALHQPTVSSIAVVAATVATVTATVLLVLDLVRLSTRSHGPLVSGVVPGATHPDTHVQ